MHLNCSNSTQDCTVSTTKKKLSNKYRTDTEILSCHMCEQHSLPQMMAMAMFRWLEKNWNIHGKWVASMAIMKWNIHVLKKLPFPRFLVGATWVKSVSFLLLVMSKHMNSIGFPFPHSSCTTLKREREHKWTQYCRAKTGSCLSFPSSFLALKIWMGN